MKDTSREECDLIMRVADNMFRNGYFEEFDLLLRSLPVKELTTQQVVTYCTVARWAQHKLPYYYTFLRDAVERLRELKGSEAEKYSCVKHYKTSLVFLDKISEGWEYLRDLLPPEKKEAFRQRVEDFKNREEEI